jgi:GT2 family glycosyltransferase
MESALKKAMSLTLSVIIPTYRRGDFLARALASLERELAPGSEVIVVDQSLPNPSVVSSLRERFPFMIYVHRAEPNLPAARNEGIFRSHGDILFFLDDDAVVLSGCIAEHLTLHEWKGIGAVAGRIRIVNGSPWPEAREVTRIDPATGESAGNFDLDTEGPVLYACGAHFSVKRSAVGAAGLFDPNFRGNALFEEADFFYRMRATGLVVWYTPRAVVEHHCAPDGGCRAREGTAYLLDRIHNHALFYFRHVQRLPSRAFLQYMKNIAEFVSRDGKGGHSLPRLLRCADALVRGFLHARVQVGRIDGEPRGTL